MTKSRSEEWHRKKDMQFQINNIIGSIVCMLLLISCAFGIYNNLEPVKQTKQGVSNHEK